MRKVYVVTGNQGKSVFSYYLASELARRKQKVALIQTDGCKPMFRLLFPTKQPVPGRSLGRLLSLAAVTKNNVLQNAQMASNILIFSYAEGESALSYPEITQTNLSNFYNALSLLVDVMVVDTAAPRNAIDAFFLDKGDEICVTSADARGAAYRENRKPQGTQILIRDSPYNALPDVLATFPEPVPVLPYSKALSSLYNGIDICDIPIPGGYRRIIRRIAGDTV